MHFDTENKVIYFNTVNEAWEYAKVNGYEKFAVVSVIQGWALEYPDHSGYVGPFHARGE